MYFKTSSAYFLLGMEVYVTSDFAVDGPNPEEIMGAVVRIDKLEGSELVWQFTSCQPSKERNSSENVLGSGFSGM